MKHYLQRFFAGFLFILNLACYSQTLTVNSTSISCATLGSATISVSGGIGPFSHTWIPSGQTGSVATGLSPGTYSIVTNDAGASTTSTTTTVFTSPVPFTSTITLYEPSCFTACNGVALINLAGGSGNQSYFSTNGIATFTTAHVGPLCAGSYSYQVIDAVTACSLSGTFILTQPPALTLSIIPSTVTACIDGSVTLTGAASGGTPGYTYSWVNGPATNTFVISQNTPGAYIYTLVSQDSYTCAINNTISITFISKPFPNITTNFNICVGGTLALAGSGASAYQWSGPSGFTSSAQNPSISPLSLSNSGIYSVVATATTGCSSTATQVVNVGTLPTITLSAPPICEAKTLTLTANSSNGVSYFWSGPSGYSSSAQISLIGLASVNNSGTYTLTAFTNSNCQASATINATVIPTPTLIAIGSTVCVGRTASLTALSQPGVTYLWSGPLSFSSTQQNTFVTSPSLSQTGIYTVMVTSAAGCTNVATAGIALMANPVPTITTNSPICVGGTLTLTGNGGFLYNWTGPGGFIDVIQTTSLVAVNQTIGGVYNLTVTALNSCSATINTTVTVNASPTVSAAGSTVCAGQTLTLAANSGTGSSYFWVGPSNFIANSQSVSISSSTLSHSGDYTVTVTDVNSCTNTAIANVNVSLPPNISVSLNSTSICAQGLAGSPNTIVLSAAGAPAYTLTAASYLSNSNPSGPTSNLSLLPPYQFSGPTTLTLQGSDGICTVSLTAGLMVYPNPTNVAITNATPSVCIGQSVALVANGASTYSWSTSATASFIVVSSQNSTSYALIGTDLNGCSNVATTMVWIMPPPSNVLTVSSPPAVCIGVTATIAAIGATSYSWSSSATGSAAVVSPTATTIYTVYASNPFNCTSEFTVGVVVVNCTGFSEVTKESRFLIYPNPAQEFINIQIENENSFESVEIINNLGQVIFSDEIRDTDHKTINVSEFASGFYFLQLKSSSGVVSKRFVISK